jgi:hypothetical protein
VNHLVLEQHRHNFNAKGFNPNERAFSSLIKINAAAPSLIVDDISSNSPFFVNTAFNGIRPFSHWCILHLWTP